MSHVNDQAVQIAQRWYGQHRNEYLSVDRNQMIDRCAMRLCEVFDMSKRAAGEIAVKVWGELQSKTPRWHVDLEQTTQQVLVLVTNDGAHRRVLTVDELLSLDQPRWVGVDFGTPDRAAG